MYALEIARAAQMDLLTLRAFDRARVLVGIRADLVHSPAVQAGNRKMLHDLRPAWEHVPPLWQLRVGDFRVFYDVDELAQVVYIRRVVRKGRKMTGEIT